MPPQLIQHRAKIFRQRGDDLERVAVEIRQPQLLGVQGEAGDERAFSFAAGGAVILTIAFVVMLAKTFKAATANPVEALKAL